MADERPSLPARAGVCGAALCGSTGGAGPFPRAVEHLVSHQAAHFESLKDLLAFIVCMVTKPPAASVRRQRSPCLDSSTPRAKPEETAHETTWNEPPLAAHPAQPADEAVLGGVRLRHRHAQFVQEREAEGRGVVDSKGLKKNADGSVDVFFRAECAKGSGDNWAQTQAGRFWFPYFRHAPWNPPSTSNGRVRTSRRCSDARQPDRIGCMRRRGHAEHGYERAYCRTSRM